MNSVGFLQRQKKEEREKTNRVYMYIYIFVSLDSVQTCLPGKGKMIFHMVMLICREEEGRRKVKRLQKQLIEIKREKEDELQQRNEMIAHLKVGVCVSLV